MIDPNFCVNQQLALEQRIAELEAQLAELKKQKPAYTFHLDSTGAAYLKGACVSKEGDPLYTAPVVPDGMVLVPREPSYEWIERVIRFWQPSLAPTSFAWNRNIQEMRYWHEAMIAAYEDKK